MLLLTFLLILHHAQQLITSSALQDVLSGVEEKRGEFCEEIDKIFHTRAAEHFDMEAFSNAFTTEIDKIKEAINNLNPKALLSASIKNQQEERNEVQEDEAVEEKSDYRFLLLASDKEENVNDVKDKLLKCFKEFLPEKVISITICIIEYGMKLPTQKQLEKYSAMLVYTYKAPPEPLLEPVSEAISYFITECGGVAVCHAGVRDDHHGVPVLPADTLPVDRGAWKGRERVTWKNESSPAVCGVLCGVVSADSGVWGSHTDLHMKPCLSTDEYQYEKCAEWSDGTVLVATSKKKGNDYLSCAVVNVLPPSSDADADFWPVGDTLCDGPARILCNALLMCSNNRTHDQ